MFIPDPDPDFSIPDPDPDFFHPGSGSRFFSIPEPDPGVKKAPDPVSGSATHIDKPTARRNFENRIRTQLDSFSKPLKYNLKTYKKIKVIFDKLPKFC
jgi:hypothetical protein